jgi:hypothetical protein
MSVTELSQSFREIDHQQEKVVDKFLHKFFYSKVFSNVEFVDDVSLQVAGVDVIADGKLIDNKSQSSPRYVNNPTNTFILELSFLNKYEKESVGWFIKEDSKTTHYLFVWINRADVDSNGRILPNGIHEVEVMLVDRNQLRESVANYYTDEELMRIANGMRCSGHKWSPCSIPDCKFSHTPTLAEKPTNIVARKSFLETCSVMHCVVGEYGIVHI